jgi:hypothetical protein
MTMSQCPNNVSHCRYMTSLVGYARRLGLNAEKKLFRFRPRDPKKTTTQHNTTTNSFSSLQRQETPLQAVPRITSRKKIHPQSDHPAPRRKVKNFHPRNNPRPVEAKWPPAPRRGAGMPKDHLARATQSKQLKTSTGNCQAHLHPHRPPPQ